MLLTTAAFNLVKRCEGERCVLWFSDKTKSHHRRWCSPKICENRHRVAAYHMDAFYEEDERIMGDAADSYHRIDVRQTSRSLVVRHHDRVVAETKPPPVLYESGFAPRWYVSHADIDESALTFVEHQTFCPYKGLCSYYDVGDGRLGAWSYREAFPEVSRISGLASFEPDIVSVQLDGSQLSREPGQAVIPHDPDRELTVAEARARR